IQHTHPEFLQKFISLCDAQRRVEGVWKGETRTYDLRGKRFCVCMAGNPYTESGERFRIPDMLANRADIYNLGDILEGRDEAFALSYIENSITSNPLLAQLASRSQEDIYKLVRMAQGEEIQADQLSHAYSAAELADILSVLKKLMHIQGTLLKINQAYIHSASQSEDFRKEPPFRLQGSYRNMNKLAERVVPVMNEEELEAHIDDHYRGEAQTLTKGAESNLLKLAELRNRLTDSQSARWSEIKHRFNRLQSQGGPDDDPVTRVVSQLNEISTHLSTLSQTLSKSD
ncbi:MAG TPA: DNA repair protein, partial [Acidobacteriota bacterium]|nr:DNA repair protein [Acidobacteriota bacterium]